MQVFKHFLVWAWPGHGFGKEIQEKALAGPGQDMALVRKCKRKPCLGLAPQSSQHSQQTARPASQPGQAASQPGYGQIP